MPVGKEGVHCVFTSSLVGCSSSGLTTVGAFLAESGTAGLSYVPLLNVTTTLTSSILALGSLAEPISCIPLGFCSVWEGYFPFSGPCCRLGQPGNGTLQVIIFVRDLKMHTVYLLVE